MINKDNWLELSNGVLMPPVGFGTDRVFLYLRKNIFKGVHILINDLIKDHRYHMKRDLSIFKIVKSCPKEGCFLFDTASSYAQSERVLGHCLKKYNRNDYFVCTKLSNEEQRKGDVFRAFEASRKKLKVDVVDLYLMHWPQTNTFIDCWLQMEELYKKGYVKAIGVCNFKKHHFDELFTKASIIPHVCQIESHPLFSQIEMRYFCRENNIQMMAYTPTGRMDKRIVENPVIRSISERHNKSIAQIIVRWHYQNSVIPIINTTKIEHLIDNVNVFDFCLDQEEMNQIDGMNRNIRLRYDPDNVDFYKC